MPVESAYASLARHFSLLPVSGYSIFLRCHHVPLAGQLFLAPIGGTFIPLYAEAGNSRYLRQPATPAAGHYPVNGGSNLAFIVGTNAEMFAHLITGGKTPGECDRGAGWWVWENFLEFTD